jgi:hypothetical protein
MEDFGIIVACCDQDYLFTKGCCASIRHFLGDVPICLLVDGTFSNDSLEKAYGVQVINRLNVKNPILKQRSFGWGLTKMVAFWESPWKNFLLIDSDTIVWGNILKFANFQNFDVIIDRPCYEYSDEAITEYFFDIEGLEKHFPNFNWRQHRAQYYNTGATFAKRDIFSLDEYLDILDFISKNPKVFKYGEMGFLNFMIFRAADEGRIRLGQEDMQLLVPDFDQEKLKNRFPVEETGPVVQDDEATVIHWCGPKPILSTTKVYTEPMSFCRRKFLHDAENLTASEADSKLKGEDFQRNVYIYKNKVRRKLKGMRSKVAATFLS